jgi:hypothetical protein
VSCSKAASSMAMNSIAYIHIGRPPRGNETGDHDDDTMEPSIHQQQQSNNTNTHESFTSMNPQNQRQKTRAVILFSMTVILLFADQNLMAPNLTAMARDFGFTDTQRDVKLGGDIALAFFFLGAPASYVVGILADGDRFKRVQLFAVVVGLGEGACAMTFLTRNYRQLYFCRAITGFSLGGALPLIYSILGDLYAAEQRHMVSSLVGIGAGMGIALGQGVAGFLGPTMGWRLPFLVVSIPALLCAALVLLTVDEPERGGMEQAARACHEPCRQDDNESAMFRHEHNQEDEDEKDASSVASDLRSTVELPPLDSSDLRGKRPRVSNLRTTATTCRSHDEEHACYIESLARRIEHDVLLVDETPEYHHMVDGDHHCCSALKTLLSTPTVLLALLQGGPGCIPWGILNTYLNDYLAENRGMTVEVSC